jgi:hypothetical protein
MRQADIERRLSNLAKAPRCGARTQAGHPCRQAALLVGQGAECMVGQEGRAVRRAGKEITVGSDQAFEVSCVRPSTPRIDPARPSTTLEGRRVPEQICAVVAMTCEKPSESERPISQWSQQSSAELSIGLCAGQTAGVIDWRINEIAQIVEPDEAQRAVLEELKTAMTKAVDLLKAGCPTDLPSTPTGRIEAMRMCALPPCWRPCAPCARRSPNSMTC